MLPEPLDLDVQTHYAGDTATVVVAGEIDLASSTKLNRELDAVLDRVPAPMQLRIDLGGAGYMDTTGVAVLLKARRRALDQGCRFAVISASSTLTRLFEITGLASLLADIWPGPGRWNAASGDSAIHRNSPTPVSWRSLSKEP